MKLGGNKTANDAKRKEAQETQDGHAQAEKAFAQEQTQEEEPIVYRYLCY